MNNTLERILIVCQTFFILSVTNLWCDVSSSSSRLILQDSRQLANGYARVKIGIELRDEKGDPVSNRLVTLESDNSSFIFVQPSETDLNGSATGYVACRSESSGNVWGMIEGLKIFPNLLQNSSAELGESSPSDWSQFSNRTLTDQQQFLWEESNESQTGKSLGIKVSGTDDPYELSWFQEVQSRELVSGSTYMISALVCTDAGYFAPDILSGISLSVLNENDSNNPVTSSKSPLSQYLTEWQELNLSSVVFPSGASQVEVSLDLVRSTGVVWFDNVRMTLYPSIIFSQDSSSPSIISHSSPTFLTARPGDNNGEIKINWFAVGNDGMLWPNPEGNYEVRISKDFGLLSVSSWTLVNPKFSPANPGDQESLVLAGLDLGTTYQIAIRAVDQSANKPEFGFTLPIIARNGVNPITFLTLDQISESNQLVQWMNSQPTFTGTTRTGSIVKVSIDGTLDGTAYSDFEGKWKYQVQNTVSEGSHIASFQAVDFSGNTSANVELAFQVGVPLASDELKNPYPNPVRLSESKKCHFQFSLVAKTRVCIRVFNFNGTEIENVVDQEFDRGSHIVSWDGRNRNGALVSSNSYFVLFETEKEREVKLFTVLR